MSYDTRLSVLIHGRAWHQGKGKRIIRHEFPTAARWVAARDAATGY
jgi:hypothetical protein